MTKTSWGLIGLIVVAIAAGYYVMQNKRELAQVIPAIESTGPTTLPVQPAPVVAGALPAQPTSTEGSLSPQPAMPIDSNDMQWFYDRFGESTWLDESKFNVKTFTLEEYRKLIEASPSNDVATVALKITLLKYLKDHPNDPEYKILKEKLYSKEFLISHNFFNHLGEVLPNDILDNKPLVMEIVQKNGYFIRWASERLRGDEEVATAVMQQCPYCMEYLSDKLLSDKRFVMQQLSGGRVSFSLSDLKGSLNGDKEVVLAVLRKNPHDFAAVGDRLKNDPAILLIIKNHLMENGGEALGDMNINSIPEKLKADKEFMAVYERMHTDANVPQE